MFWRKKRKLKKIREAYEKLTEEDIRTHTLDELEKMCGITEEVNDTNYDWSHGGFYRKELTQKDMDKMRKKFDKIAKRLGCKDV